MVADSELQRIARLTPLADVLSSFDIGVGAVEPRDETIANALGKTLAADVAAPSLRPEAALALRDGYAVRADATTDATSYTPLPLSPAPPRIGTGERMPPDTDAVAALDAISMQAQDVAGARRRRSRRRRAAGRRRCRAGHRPENDRRAAAQDRRRRIARARHRARADPRAAPARGARRRRRDHRRGGSADRQCNRGGRRRRDAVGGAQCALEAALHHEGADAIVAIGGTGSGATDTSVRTLERAGKVAFHGIGITPGETTAFGYVGARPVLLLPGRLDAALAGWLTVGRRMLARLAFRLIEEQPFNAELSRKIASPLGLAEVVPVRRRGFRIEPLASHYLPMQSADPRRRLDPGARRQRRLSGGNERAGEAVAVTNKPDQQHDKLLAAVREAARQEQFLEVVSAEEARRRFEGRLDLSPLPGERVTLAHALGRVLAR